MTQLSPLTYTKCVENYTLYNVVFFPGKLILENKTKILYKFFTLFVTELLIVQV